MVPPLFLHLHSSSSVPFCACITRLSFFCVEKEKKEKKKTGYEGEIALASKIKLLQHG